MPKPLLPRDSDEWTGGDYIPHFKPSSKGLQHDMAQIEKARAISYAWWRAQFDKHIRAAHDEIYGTSGGSFRWIDGRKCYNDLNNMDEYAYTPGSACYEFFKFIGFDDQAFHDMEEALDQDDAEHIDYIWSPNWTYTIDDFGIAVEWVNSQMAGKKIRITHNAWGYDPNSFPDYNDRPARSILDVPHDFGEDTIWDLGELGPNYGFYGECETEPGVYCIRRENAVREFDRFEIIEVDPDTGDEIPLDIAQHRPLYMMVEGLMTITKYRFLSPDDENPMQKAGETETLLGSGYYQIEGYSPNTKEYFIVDFKPGLIDFINNEYPAFEMGQLSMDYMWLVGDTSTLYEWAPWYINMFWEGRNEVIAPTMSPEEESYGMFRVDDGDWYLDVENFLKAPPDIGSYFLGQFSTIDVDEEDKRRGLFGIIAGIIGAVFGFGDLVIEVILVKLTLDIIALTISLITGEEFRAIRAKLGAIFMAYGGIKGIAGGGGFWAGTGSAVISAGNMLLLSAQTIAGVKLFTALPSIQDMRKLREEAERKAEEQEMLREQKKEEAKKKAMQQTLGDMESHQDLDDFMYSRMFMPLELLKMDDPFGANGEFAIKFA